MASIQISTFDEKVIATINTRQLDKDVLVKRVLKAVDQAEYVDWVTYEGDDGYETPILDDDYETQEEILRTVHTEPPILYDESKTQEKETE